MLITLATGILLNSCIKPDETPITTPWDHTLSMGGHMHKPGLMDARTNCIECHGDDLRGGTSGVSCYYCHNQKWN